jgi:hypothetical protein
MTPNKKIIAVTACAAALGGGGAAVASPTGAVGGEGNEKPINGPALERASTAALAHTGQGAVSDTEVGDEESYYEVEVTLDNGSQTDVQLDRDFNVVGSEAAQGGEDEGGGK